MANAELANVLNHAHALQVLMTVPVEGETNAKLI
jgi:hypothetical protein